MTASHRFCILLLAAGLLAPEAAADVLTGKIVDPNGAGVARVKVKVGRFGTRGKTDVFGVFSVTVPAGTYDVGFEPQVLTLAPRLLPGIKVAGTTNLGTVALVVGHALSGTVVDAANVPILTANLKVRDLATGRNLFTPNNVTNLAGKVVVVVPAGTYRLRIRPPTGRLLVGVELKNVRVTQPTSFGTVVLRAGVLVTGTVLDAATNLPVFDVDLDADDAMSGKRIFTPGDNTDTAGRFKLILPPGLFHLSFDPPPGSNLIGLRRFNVPITGTTNVGNVTLARGFAIAGTAAGPAGGIAGANINVRTVPGDENIFLSNDKTSATGAFRVVVAPGRYVLTVEPPVATLVAGARTAPFMVAANVTLPRIALPAGVVVSGTVLGFDKRPEPDLNLDVLDPVSGVELITAGDRTDVNGHYALVAPKGRWNVRFQPRKVSLSREELRTGIAVNGPTRLDVGLRVAPVVAFIDTLGVPTVGQNGPVLTHLAFVNPTASVQNTVLSMTLIDPDGGRTPLFPSFQLPLFPLQFALLVNLPMPLPRVKTAFLGKIFRLELRFVDAKTRVVQDFDKFRFIIR